MWLQCIYVLPVLLDHQIDRLVSTHWIPQSLSNHCYEVWSSLIYKKNVEVDCQAKLDAALLLPFCWALSVEPIAPIGRCSSCPANLFQCTSPYEYHFLRSFLFGDDFLATTCFWRRSQLAGWYSKWLVKAATSMIWVKGYFIQSITAGSK